MKKEAKYCIDVVVVRIKNQVTLLYKNKWLNKNMFETQTMIYRILSLLFRKEDFDVNIYCNDVTLTEDDKITTKEQ